MAKNTDELLAVGGIDLTPQWSGVVRIYIAAMENGTNEAKSAATTELLRMAKLADIGVALEKERRATAYQGFANMATWRMNAWLGNEQGSATALDLIAQDKNLSTEVKADDLERWVEAHLPSVGHGITADLVNDGLASINWREIIEHHEEG